MFGTFLSHRKWALTRHGKHKKSAFKGSSASQQNPLKSLFCDDGFSRYKIDLSCHHSTLRGNFAMAICHLKKDDQVLTAEFKCWLQSLITYLHAVHLNLVHLCADNTLSCIYVYHLHSISADFLFFFHFLPKVWDNDFLRSIINSI